MSALRRAFIAATVGLMLAPAQAPAATPPPAGFHAGGTLVVAATFSGSPLNVGGNVVLFARGSMYRLDVLSLAFPGTDATASAVAGALLAPGGATLLYDGATGDMSAYSTGNHVFYQDLAKPNPRPARSTASAGDDTGIAGPLATLAAVARQLHDVAHASILLTGHGTTNGHPTEDFDLLVDRQRPGKPHESYHAQISLADDLDGFPVRIAASSTAPTPQDFGGSLRLDLTTVARDSPDPSVFTIPAGLTRVDSLSEVIQAKR